MKEEVSIHSETPSQEGTVGGELQSEAQQQIHGRQSGKNSAQRSVPTSTPQSETLVRVPAVVSGGWVLRLRLRKSHPRERPGVDHCEDTLRGLV